MLTMLVQAGIQAGAIMQPRTAGVAAKPSPVDAAAKDFEAQFVSQMLGYMFEGIKTNELFGGGEAEDVYRSFMIDEYGKIVSQSGGLGISDYIKRQLVQLQEVKA